MTPALFLSSHGRDAARYHGLHGVFFASGGGIFFEAAAGDIPHKVVAAVEWLARLYEDEGLQEVQRREPSIHGFSLHGPAFPRGQPDPWDAAWLEREERMRKERAERDRGKGGSAPDAKRERAAQRNAAAYPMAAMSDDGYDEDEGGDHEGE